MNLISVAESYHWRLFNFYLLECVSQTFRVLFHFRMPNLTSFFCFSALFLRKINFSSSFHSSTILSSMFEQFNLRGVARSINNQRYVNHVGAYLGGSGDEEEAQDKN